MDIEPFSVPLVCLFCGRELQAVEDAEFQSGDLIKCQACEEENDYDSLIEVAKGKGIAEVKGKVEDHLKKELGNLFGKRH
jgi:hypothetical protein